MFIFGQYQKRGVLLLVILLFVVVASDYVFAYAGNYCNSTSPCACGDACKGGGYENETYFNTIDGYLLDGCHDGSDDQYEYVEDFNVTDLDRARFTGGDNVLITAAVECDDAPGDYIAFIYHNGSGWRNLGFETCNVNGIHQVTKNFTLDSYAGNHTVRVAIFWSYNADDACAASAICGRDCDPVYTDTDDIVFLVEEKEYDSPSVILVSPGEGEEYEYSSDYVIDIVVNASDANEIDYVSVQVDWDSQYSIFNLSQEGDFFVGNFSGSNCLGRYNLTVFAADSFGNLNDSVSSFFFINKSLNITIFSPVNDHYYSQGNADLYFSVRDDYDLGTVAYSFNQGSQIKDNLTVGSENLIFSGDSLNNTLYPNISQSFNLSESIELGRVKLFLKQENLTGNVSLSLYSGYNTSSGRIASSSLDSTLISESEFSWITFSLNDTLLMENSTRYWLVLEDEGNSSSFLSWGVNDNLYSGGSAYLNNTDTGKDCMFVISHEFLFNTSLTLIPGVNNLTIFKNNTLGVQQSKSISFTYDNSLPYVVNVDYLDAVELGSYQNVSVVVSDIYSSVDSVMVSVDSVNYSMSKINSTFFVYDYIPLNVGSGQFILYLNDSAGNTNHSVEYNFSVVDTSAPVLNSVDYSPYSGIDLDPGVPISFVVNVFDHSNVSSVFLDYRLISSPSWDVLSMNLSGGLYYSNFTPLSSGTYEYMIMAVDEYNNSYVGGSSSVLVEFDYSWLLQPDSFGVNGSVIGGTISLSPLIINNTADFNKSFNISYVGNPLVNFNTTSPVVVGPNSFERIALSITLPILEGDYDVVFIVTDLINGSSDYSNTTVVAFESGPYLFIELPVYDASVTLGEHIDLISIKVTNLGNESSTNTTLVVELPDGLSSRDDIDVLLGDIGVGQSKSFNFSVDISSSATPGTGSIIFLLNNSEGADAVLSKLITLNEDSSDDDGPSSGGSKSFVSSGGILGVSPEPVSFILDLSLTPGFVEVPRGGNVTLLIRLVNNISQTDFFNVSYSMDGLFHNYYSLSNTFDSELLLGDYSIINVSVMVPKYMESGKTVLSLIIETDKGIITKEFELVIVDSGFSISDCIDSLFFELLQLKEEGFFTADLEGQYSELKRNYQLKDYEKSGVLCDEIAGYVSLVRSLDSRLVSVRSKIGSYSEDDPNKNSFDSALSIIETLFNKGDYDAAEETLSKLELLLKSVPAEEQPMLTVLKSFVFSNLIFILLLVPVVVGSMLFVRHHVFQVYKKIRLSEIRKEEDTIKDLIVQSQKDYFENRLLSEGNYNTQVGEYFKRLSLLKYKSIELDVKSKHIIFDSLKQLESKKRQLEDTIVELQLDYFDKKLIGASFYKSMIRHYEVLIAGVNAQLADKHKGEKSESDNPLVGQWDFGDTDSLIVPVQRGNTVDPSADLKKRCSGGSVHKMSQDNFDNIKTQDLTKNKNYKKEEVEITPGQSLTKENFAAQSDLKKVGSINKKEVLFRDAGSGKEFVLSDGHKIASIGQFIAVLPNIPDEFISHHVTSEKNDFAAWINHVFGVPDLSSKLRLARNKEDMLIILKEYFK